MKIKNKFLQIYYEKHYLFSLAFILILLLLFSFCLSKYLLYIDSKANKIKNNTEISYTLEKETKLANNMYYIDLEKDLNRIVKDEKQNTITYKIEGEDFYFDIRIYQEKKMRSYEVVKVVDEFHDVTAKINYTNVLSMEYKADPKGTATVIKFNTKDNSEFLAITDQTYYFLGEDIDDISFVDDEFRYKSVNPKYDVKEMLKVGCTQKIIDSIDEFDFKEPYYFIGKINFLDDYYQKIGDSTSSVEEKCEELQK